MISKKSKRQSWVDFARGIAIILVVYRHAFIGLQNTGIHTGDYIFLEYFNIIFFSFRMPLFFIVSGIFLSASLAKRGFARYAEVKARTILYPYFLWGFIQITLQIVFSKYANSDRDVHDYLYLFYQPRQIEQFWYLLALFNVSLLYVILRYILKLRIIWLVLIAIIMYYFSAFCHRKNIEIGFLFDIFSFFIYIIIGDLLHKTMTNKKNIKMFESWRFPVILLIPFVTTQLYFLDQNLDHSNISSYRYVEYYQPTLFFIIAIIGCVFVLSLCFLLQKIGRINWLRVLGKHSLYIYCAHVICFATARAVMINFFHITSIPFLLFGGIISGLYVPVILYRISAKLNFEWIFALKERPLPNYTISTESSLSLNTEGITSNKKSDDLR